MSESEASGLREWLTRELRLTAAIRTKKARESLAEFVRFTKPDFRMGWFHRTLCGLLDEFLDDVVAKRSPRVILCSPPQFGKSELVSRRFPPYLLGRHPSLRVIATSYGSSLANDLSRDVQAIMDSNGFHKLFPVRTGWGRCSSPSRTDTNSGPPPPYRSVGGSSMNSSTGGHSESMSQRDYNACRDAGGGGGRGRR